MTKLSIITICYNEPNLESTCESIINQAWQDFEWIVVDGGSNKETLDIFEKYKDRMSVFISEKDNGRYNAFNKALKYVKGEYIHFLNAGDYYFDNNVLLNVFEKNMQEKDVLHGNLCFKGVKDVIRTTDYKEIAPEFFINQTLFHPATFIKSKFFNLQKGFYFDENYKIAGDLEMWIALAKSNASFEYIPYTISVFNTEGISENPKYNKLNKEEREKIFNKYFSKEIINKERQKDMINKLSFKEKFFSLKNNADKTYKMLTVCGLHFKINKKGDK